MCKSIKNTFKKIIEAAAKWVEKCIPVYDPAAWNDNNGIQYNNNCYNYGCDIKTGTYAQPGRAHGITVTQNDLNNCEKVVSAAQADGLKPVDCDKGCGCEKCQHQVALVVSPLWDYHWYRKDRDGRWSHKMGWTAATNLDNSGNIITDPRIADRGSYSLFCGCFCVDKSSVVIS